MSLDVELLGAQVLSDPDGTSQVLGDRWSERRSLVLFLRHFG